MIWLTTCILVIIGIWQLIKYFLDVEKDNTRVLIFILTVSLAFTQYVRPYGLINFESFEKETVFEASQVGGGNCNTKLKLYHNLTFVERERCFGTSTKRGTWKLSNDTIFFAKPKSFIFKTDFAKFATVKPNLSIRYNGVMYKFLNKKDSLGSRMFVTKNDLFAK